MTGCATAGTLQTSKDAAYFKPINTIFVGYQKEFEGPVSGSLGPSLSTDFIPYLERYFKRKGYVLGGNDADLKILISDVSVGSWTGQMWISDITLDLVQGNTIVESIRYSQHTEAFTIRSLFRPSKLAPDIANYLAKTIYTYIKTK